MTNFEKYIDDIKPVIREKTKKDIRELMFDDIAIDSETGDVMQCSLSNCKRCRFNDEFGCDSESLRDWLDSPYKGE